MRRPLAEFAASSGPEEMPGLRLLRALLSKVDEPGTLLRVRIPPGTLRSLNQLESLGILEVAVDPEPVPDGTQGEQWFNVQFTDAATAELFESDDARDIRKSQIDRRLLELADSLSGTTAPPEDLAPSEAPSVGDQFTAVPLEVEPADEEVFSSGESLPQEPSASPFGEVAPEAGGSTLASRGLVKVYRKRRVVNEVDLYLRQGEIVGLLGPNGAGKTTTFYMVVGLIKPDRGKVYLADEDVTDVPMYRRARRGVGYLAQEPSIFRKLSVEENVLAVLQMLGLSRREQRERLEGLLDELGIKHLRHTKAYALSGGERRRLEITRALVGDPKFMLLDEPFAGVDPIAVHDIQQIVSDLRRRGIGVLISDHNVEQTLDIVDRAYIMYDGRVRVSGTVSQLVWSDEVAEIYLGPTLTARMRQRYVQPH
jgi:LPS export ABC transporter ATP-binding protein